MCWQKSKHGKNPKSEYFTKHWPAALPMTNLPYKH